MSRWFLRTSILTLSLLFLHAASDAQAFTDLLLGKQATFVDKTNPKQDSAKFNYAKDPALYSLQSPLCPAVSKLQILTSNGRYAETTLDCTKWKTTGSGFRYSAKPGGPGGVRSIVYSLGRLNVRVQDAPYSTNPVTGPISFVETRFGVGATSYCGRFQAPPSTFKVNSAGKIVIKGPSVPCQGVCGDGFLEANEQCDDGNTVGGDCCDATCSFEVAGSACADDANLCTDDVCDGAGACTHASNTVACDDHSGCTQNDACSGGTCTGELLPPWVNEFDYDSNDGFPNYDYDEFVEIAGPAGTDLSGYRVLAVEGAGPQCSTGFFVNAGDAHFDLAIPDGAVLADDTGTGIGFYTVCFAHTSLNVVAAGKCDVVLPAPFSDSNLKNGSLLNGDEWSCPDGILVLDPDDNMVDAISYEGTVANAGLYGPFFHVTPYVAERDEGWLAGVSIIKTTSTLARATSATEWKDPSELGPIICDGQIGFFCPTLTRSPGAKNAGQNLACGSPCAAFLDAPAGLLD